MPLLRPDQSEIVLHPEKIQVCDAGRRFGKTIAGGSVGLATATWGGHVAWIVPEYSNGDSLWRWLVNRVGPIHRRGGCRINRATRTIEFPSSRGFISLFSAKNANAIRGWSFHLVICDEAARFGEDVFDQVILPTLADYNGSALLWSTPAGKNWFYRLWLLGQQAGSGVKSWMLPTSMNPLPTIQNAFNTVKARVESGDYLRRVFEEEWLGIFVDDFGGVFENVRAQGIGTWLDRPERHHRYVIGADWGKLEDYTVLLVRDIDEKRVVHFDRSNGLSYVTQRKKLADMIGLWQPEMTVCEQNSMGEPIIDELEAEGFKVVRFLTKPESKKLAVEQVALEFAKGLHIVPRDERALAEYENFSSKRSLTGAVRYQARPGFHDDIVMADAMATWGSNELDGLTMTQEEADYLERMLA